MEGIGGEEAMAGASTPKLTREQLMAMIPEGLSPEMKAAAMEGIEEVLRQQENGTLQMGMGPDGEPGIGMEDGEEFGDEGAMPGAAPGGAAGGSAAGGGTPDQVKKRREQLEKARKQAEHFRLLVVAGDWPSVHTFLKTEAGEDAEQIYEWILTNLMHSDTAIVPDEVISISEASPVEMNDKLVNKLGGLLKSTQRRGCQAGAVAARIAVGTEHFGGQDPVKRKRAAGLLVAAGLPVQAQAYLPPLEQARASRDAELLNLYAIYFAALAKERTGQEREAAIDQGWKTSLEALGVETASSRERSKAIERALGFIEEIPAETGDAWLRSLFATPGDTGWEAIERVNRKSMMLKMRQAQPAKRMAGLLIIKRVGNGILAASPEVIENWRTGLNMLTLTIMDEAEMTRSSPGNQANQYGGYGGEYGGYGDGRMQPIQAEVLGTALPEAKWLGAIDAGLAAKLELMAAATAGGAGNTQAVLDMIRPIVQSDAERARKLADALLRAWPNFVRSEGAGGNDDPYGYGGYGARYGRYYGGGYGYGGGGGIPLTRAKQERNLEKFRDMMRDLDALKIPELPTDAVVEAFAASYSPAEVYTAEHIELVFGPIAKIPNETRLKIATQMRRQLAGAWRSPQVQEQAGTKRTNVELAAEVLRGYELAQSLAGAGEETWERIALEGDLYYDQAEFVYGQNSDMQAYDQLRVEAFGRYAQAAEIYKGALSAGKTKPSARVYSQWFSAAMGASDLGFLTRQDRPDLQQIDDVREAILGVGSAEQASKHVGLFAKEIARSSQEMSPELKPKYLREALRIIGDHPDGADARDKLAFYDDLNKEVALDVRLDGPSEVGVDEVFGVNIAVRSTRAVTRESGGFSKYLMNEQYNPMTGQPVNYKDDLEKQLRERWGTSFEVLSVNFHKPMQPAIGAGREGWELSPLAYVLLKSKDPKIDRLPDIKMDMDFSDGGGLVILPITSSPVPVDSGDRQAKAAAPGVSIEQIFDDREAPTGTVRLEVRATGKGVMPRLEEIVKADYGSDLKVTTVEDHGVNVLELDTSTGRVVPTTERSWSIALQRAHAGQSAERFAFPVALAKDAQVANKRYTDADVVDAPLTVQIAGMGREGTPGWVWWSVAGAAVLAGIGGFAAYKRSRTKTAAPVVSEWIVPEVVTPMGAISILRRVAALNGTVFNAQEQREIDREIATLEHAYFAPTQAAGGAGGNAGTPPTPSAAELKNVVRKWVARVDR